MANPNVLFSRGSSLTFPSVVKDPNTLYFLTDTHEVYLGSERYAVGSDVSVVISGVGDTVSDVTWDLSTKTLTFKLGDASEAESIVEAIEESLSACIKTITTDRGSSILVDSSDPENVKLSLNIAQGDKAGNVLIEECSDGLKASVEIPEDAIQGIASGEKVLSLDGSNLKSNLSITTLKENDVTYVVLRGIDNQEVSRFDASDFVKDGMLDSVSLEYSSDGSNHRLIVFVFNTASGKETIKVDVQEFIDIYVAAQNGGLKLDDNAFSIDNQIESSDFINTDVVSSFGETITLNTIKYDEHGLITGKGQFTFTLPNIAGGSVGGSDKLIKAVTIGSDGSIEGSTVDISTALSSSSTDLQIPTAKAVYDAIENARTLWERF